MTQPLDLGKPWETGLMTVLGADPMDRSRFLGMPWISRTRWYVGDSAPGAAGANQFNLYRKLDGGTSLQVVNNNGTPYATQTQNADKYLIVEGEVNWYQGGENSPHDFWVKFIDSTQKALSTGPAGSVLNPETFHTAAQSFFNSWDWLGRTIQQLNTEIDKVEGGDSGFDGSAAGAFVQNLKDLQAELTMVQTDLKTNQDWVQMLHDNGDAANVFWKRITDSWNQFWGDPSHDPSAEVNKALAGFKASADALNHVEPPTEISRWDITVDFGNGPHTIDVLGDGFSQLNTAMQAFWIGNVADMDITMANQYAALRDSFDTSRLNMHDMRTYTPTAPAAGTAGSGGSTAGAGLDGIPQGGSTGGGSTGGGGGGGGGTVGGGGGGGGGGTVGGGLQFDSLKAAGGGGGGGTIGGGGSTGGGGSAGEPNLNNLLQTGGGPGSGPGGGADFGVGDTGATSVGEVGSNGTTTGGGPSGGFSGLPGGLGLITGSAGGAAGGSRGGGKNTPSLDDLTDLSGEDAGGDVPLGGGPTAVSPGSVTSGGGSNVNVPSIGGGNDGEVTLPGTTVPANGSSPGSNGGSGGGGSLGSIGGSGGGGSLGSIGGSGGGGSLGSIGGSGSGVDLGSIGGGSGGGVDLGSIGGGSGGGSGLGSIGGLDSIGGPAGSGGGLGSVGGLGSDGSELPWNPGRTPDNALSIGPLGSPPGSAALDFGTGAFGGGSSGGSGWAAGVPGGAGSVGGGPGIGALPGSLSSVGGPGAPATAPGASGMGGYPPMMPPMTPMGGNQEEKERERTTWLAEDEEVWGTDRDIVEAVIGRDGFDEAETPERAPWQPVPQNPNAPYGPARGGGRASGRGY
ncbi:hypothetical protein [Actinoplanes sp. HUAS TT8]|uniref:hypothetical protein n=1 Tax=Actinoplanes sp. HUAS TT8 TaxID=3447453 RepID=UPI003F520B0D